MKVRITIHSLSSIHILTMLSKPPMTKRFTGVDLASEDDSTTELGLKAGAHIALAQSCGR